MTERQQSPESATPLSERLQLMDERAEEIVLAHIKKSQEYHSYAEYLAENPPEAVADSLRAVASELELFGERIAAISNGAWYCDVDPDTFAVRSHEAFGITGVLRDITYLEDWGNFAYMLEQDSVEVDSIFLKGTLQRFAISLVEMGGLTEPDAL